MKKVRSFRSLTASAVILFFGLSVFPPPLFSQTIQFPLPLPGPIVLPFQGPVNLPAISLGTMSSVIDFITNTTPLNDVPLIREEVSHLQAVPAALPPATSE